MSVFDWSRFPEDRDIYLLREIAAIGYGIDVSKVEKWDMNDARREMRARGVDKPLLGGLQVKWRGDPCSPSTIYAIRNREKYESNRSEIMRHLNQFKSLGQSSLGRKMSEHRP